MTLSKQEMSFVLAGDDGGLKTVLDRDSSSDIRVLYSVPISEDFRDGI